MKADRDTVIRAWDYGNPARGGSSLWTDGKRLYSYNLCIGTRNVDGELVVLPAKVSATTNTHVSLARRAASNNVWDLPGHGMSCGRECAHVLEVEGTAWGASDEEDAMDDLEWLVELSADMRDWATVRAAMITCLDENARRRFCRGAERWYATAQPSALKHESDAMREAWIKQNLLDQDSEHPEIRPEIRLNATDRALWGNAWDTRHDDWSDVRAMLAAGMRGDSP